MLSHGHQLLPLSKFARTPLAKHRICLVKVTGWQTKIWPYAHKFWLFFGVYAKHLPSRRENLAGQAFPSQMLDKILAEENIWTRFPVL